jgi:hypothetical protein
MASNLRQMDILRCVVRFVQTFRSLISCGSAPHKGVAFLVVLSLYGTGTAVAQKENERPKVHTDFRFGSFPQSNETAETFSTNDDILMLVVGLHEGWSIDKFIKETENDRVEILTITDELEEDRLIRGRSDYDMRPGMVVLREPDLALVNPTLIRHTAEFTRMIQSRWPDVEEFVDSLEAASDMPRAEILYQIVVGGVLLGGMIDAFYDDKTLMPGPPRRKRRGSGFYAWLIEGDGGPEHIVRQSRQVGRHRVVSVGPVPSENLRVRLDDVTGPVYGDQDARRWRVFSSIFSRDHLLPFLKSKRSEFIELHESIRASKYSAFAEFLAWYYQSLVAGVTDNLVSSGLIKAPQDSYTYAIRSSR